MQTLEATRALSEVDRELISNVVHAFFAARAAGDVEGMADLVAEEIVCFPPTTWGFASYPRPLVGKAAFREAARQRHINYVVLQSAIHRVLIDGDSAAVYRSVTLRERGSGLRHSYSAINFLRFRDGRIVEYIELPDGAARAVVNNFPH